MKHDVKEKWLAALRSGDYVQGRGLLRSSEDKFCCLGVLCDLAVREGVIGEPDDRDYGFVYVNRVAGTPTAVNDWSHLKDADGIKLALMNDEGASFTEIADYIENSLHDKESK